MNILLAIASVVLLRPVLERTVGQTPLPIIHSLMAAQQIFTLRTLKLQTLPNAFVIQTMLLTTREPVSVLVPQLDLLQLPPAGILQVQLYLLDAEDQAQLKFQHSMPACVTTIMDLLLSFISLIDHVYVTLLLLVPRQMIVGGLET